MRTVQALSSLFLGISPNLYALLRAGSGRTEMRPARHEHMPGFARMEDEGLQGRRTLVSAPRCRDGRSAAAMRDAM